MTETPAAPAVHDLDEDPGAGIDAAAAAIAEGRCIVVPTDTVYGIAADAFSGDAVRGLLAAKQRGEDMPPPVLIAERSMLRALTADIPRDAMALARNFWPGALTLILKAQKTLNLELGETGGTVAVRVPDHDELRRLLRRTGPLAVSSANISGKPAANTVTEAQEMLGDAVALYLDGGESAGQVASTIVDFTKSTRGKVLRNGAIPFEELKLTAPRLQPFEEPEPEEPQLEQPATDEAIEPGPAEAGPAELDAPEAPGPSGEADAPDVGEKPTDA
ncbi:L-threonylcarbamoyladenylate synthase [Tessaracoccus rhinocerotis]|uniref:L-threonylcarbamoyladenylate synthase n=1 Tax=Tessaracoccus rhinocerotis TaxID=1689449 RepID=UPI001FE42217|nr:L-threonylcarbamoyladenylate synthase [Tessaracoccus rhinocerotis]